MQKIILKEFIECGYVEEPAKYSDLLIHEIISSALWPCIKYNHLDTLNFVYRMFPEQLKKRIKLKILSNVDYIYTITRFVFEYLFSNNLLTMNELEHEVPLSTLSKMKKYNNDALEYLLSL